VVIHMAARAGVRPSIEQPHVYEQVNVAGTLNLLEICRKLAVHKFLFGSSSSVYGATSPVPFSENQVELRPISVYAATKLAGEMLCYTYAHLFALPVICLRFFTVYGPDSAQTWLYTSSLRLSRRASPCPFSATARPDVTIPGLMG
jgi:UDP-glucuronate 4-epimerase